MFSLLQIWLQACVAMTSLLGRFFFSSNFANEVYPVCGNSLKYIYYLGAKTIIVTSSFDISKKTRASLNINILLINYTLFIFFGRRVFAMESIHVCSITVAYIMYILNAFRSVTA